MTGMTIVFWYAFIAFIHYLIWLCIGFAQKEEKSEVFGQAFSCALAWIIVDPFVIMIGMSKIVQRVFWPTAEDVREYDED